MGLHLKNKHQCKLCGEKHILDIKKHKLIHEEDKNFMCEDCGSKWSTKSDLMYHAARVHSKEGKFKCSTCGKQFGKEYQLSRHMQGHSEEKPFKCDICDKSFRRKGDLLFHIQCIHTKKMVRRENHECNVCKKSFVQKSAYTKHMRILTRCIFS